MLVRERLAISVAFLATIGLWVLPGCSTSNPRDVNYGTDVALDFVPPDAGPDATVEEAGNSVDGGEVTGEVSGQAPDETSDEADEVSDDGLQDETAGRLDAAVDGAN
jgi:hypothetical protein